MKVQRKPQTGTAVQIRWENIDEIGSHVDLGNPMNGLAPLVYVTRVGENPDVELPQTGEAYDTSRTLGLLMPLEGAGNFQLVPEDHWLVITDDGPLWFTMDEFLDTYTEVPA